MESKISRRSQRHFSGSNDDAGGFGRLKPSEYIRYLAEILEVTEERFEEVNEFCGMLYAPGTTVLSDNNSALNPFVDTDIQDLSGGQRRIINIARTFLSDPELLLLDKPLSELDSASSLEVMSALRIMSETAGCAVFPYPPPTVRSSLGIFRQARCPWRRVCIV